MTKAFDTTGSVGIPLPAVGCIRLNDHSRNTLVPSQRLALILSRLVLKKTLARKANHASLDILRFQLFRNVDGMVELSTNTD